MVICCVAAWDTWVLLWAALLQFVIAAWWWRGPHLAGSRIAGAALFALNGSAVALRVVGSNPILTVAGEIVDRLTNVALVGVALALFGLGRGTKAALIFAAAATQAAAIGLGAFLGTQPFVDLLLEAALLASMAIVIAWWAIRPHGEAAAWLVVAGLSVRFADIAAAQFVPNLLRTAPATDPWLLFQVVAHAAIVAGLIAVVTLALIRNRRGSIQAREAAGAAIALTLAGALFGAARVDLFRDLPIAFTFLVARPLAFVAAQEVMDGRPLVSSSRRWRILAAGGLACAISTSLAAAAGVAYGVPDFAAFLIGVGCVGLAFPFLRRLVDIVEPPKRDTLTARSPSAIRISGIESDRVTLPPGWEDQMRADYRNYLALDDSSRRGLDSLSRWERLFLALACCPPLTSPGPSYWRTTPGLHFATHCPYSNIGPELARTNARTGAILESLGLRAAPLGSEPLVTSTWGTAEGLRSGRVKAYALTPLGVEVAGRIQERAGVGPLPPDLLRKVLAEGFAHATSDPEVATSGT